MDVVGLRDVGGDLSGKSEVVAIEVKAGGQPFATAAGQAYGYSVYAERCYLADLRQATPRYSPEEISIASRLGIGLLAIRSTGQLEEVLSSPLHEPLEGLRLQVIERMQYSLCTICGTLFRNARVKRADAVDGRWVSRAVRDEQGLVYWLEEASKRDPRHRQYLYRRRYVCGDCISNLFGELVDRL